VNKLSGFAVSATGVLALSACSGTGQDEPAADEEVQDLTIAVVTHGAPDDSFWSVVKAGSDRAGEDLGINVEFGAITHIGQSEDIAGEAAGEQFNELRPPSRCASSTRPATSAWSSAAKAPRTPSEARSRPCRSRAPRPRPPAAVRAGLPRRAVPVPQGDQRQT
jgi:hypothetical protein